MKYESYMKYTMRILIISIIKKINIILYARISIAKVTHHCNIFFMRVTIDYIVCTTLAAIYPIHKINSPKIVGALENA